MTGDGKYNLTFLHLSDFLLLTNMLLWIDYSNHTTQEGRGHWAVYYTIVPKVFLFVALTTLGTLIEFS